MSILSSVALGWFGRRVLDWGGIALGGAFGLIQFYNAMPPQVQALVQKVATGHWQEITLGAVPGLVVWAWSQFQSYKATVRPQVVTSDGKKIESLPETVQATVEAAAAAAPRRKTIGSVVLDGLIEKLNRNR